MGVDVPTDLPNPEFEASDLQDIIAKRADEHADRDLQRDLMKDRSSYVNGVLFGFAPALPLAEQDEGWREAITPSQDDLVDESKRAARAWKHIERRHRGDS